MVPMARTSRPKTSASQRCSEDGSEARADARHRAGCDGRAGRHAQRSCELVGERCAGLNGGAFPAGRAAEEVGDEGADQNERRHAQREMVAVGSCACSRTRLLPASTDAPSRLIHLARRAIRPAPRKRISQTWRSRRCRWRSSGMTRRSADAEPAKIPTRAATGIQRASSTRVEIAAQCRVLTERYVSGNGPPTRM